MGRELPERDAADIAGLVQLGDVFGDGVVEPDFAVAHRLRQQRGLEDLAQRSEIEQRVARDRPLVDTIGPTIIEKQRAALDAHRHRDAAGTVGWYDRMDVARNDPFDLAL